LFSDCENAPELAEIVAIWPELPKHIKVAIKVLVTVYVKETD
jgi:hypothetical protein